MLSTAAPAKAWRAHSIHEHGADMGWDPRFPASNETLSCLTRTSTPHNSACRCRSRPGHGIVLQQDGLRLVPRGDDTSWQEPEQEASKPHGAPREAIQVHVSYGGREPFGGCRYAIWIQLIRWPLSIDFSSGQLWNRFGSCPKDSSLRGVGQVSGPGRLGHSGALYCEEQYQERLR